MQDIIINSPSLNPTKNVSGISSIVQFIISQDTNYNYIHFEVGRTDEAKGGLSRVFSIIGSLKNWRDLLKEHPDAIVHYNFALTKECIIRDSLYIHFCKRHKMVLHLHGGNFLFSDSMPFYLDILLKRLFSFKSPFIVLSDREKKRIEEKYHAQIVHSLPNCVDFTEAVQYVKDYDKEVLTLGYIGRITAAKGMNELIEACKVLKNEMLPFKLIIAGSERVGDNYVSVFSEQLGDSFEYAGIVSGETKTNFLKRIDVFVLPSYFEGLPVSLLETMSFGCVPVTTDVGSISTVVKNGDNGLFIKVKDSGDIVDNVKRLSKDKALLERLGRNAKQTVLEQYNPEKYIKKLDMIYQAS